MQGTPDILARPLAELIGFSLPVCQGGLPPGSLRETAGRLSTNRPAAVRMNLLFRGGFRFLFGAGAILGAIALSVLVTVAVALVTC